VIGAPLAADVTISVADENSVSFIAVFKLFRDHICSRLEKYINLLVFCLTFMVEINFKTYLATFCEEALWLYNPPLRHEYIFTTEVCQKLGTTFRLLRNILQSSNWRFMIQPVTSEPSTRIGPDIVRNQPKQKVSYMLLVKYLKPYRDMHN
jgi:hypothetical protein